MAHTRKLNMLSRKSFRLALAFALVSVVSYAMLNDDSILSRQAEAAGFVVTNTADSGAGSLRQAILNANANGSGVVDTITFNIAASGLQVIKPLTTLPTITTPTTIDGYSQSDASANTLDVGNDAILRIQIDGSKAPNASRVSLSASFRAPASRYRGTTVTSKGTSSALMRAERSARQTSVGSTIAETILRLAALQRPIAT